MASDLLYLGIGVALFFAFWNGFTDAANAISTVVATRVLTPAKAVALSAAGNFLGLYIGGEIVQAYRESHPDLRLERALS